MHGWIILDKPHGLGSTQAVSAVKRVLRQSGAGKVKVGHGGTLDPLATGVLPIAIGEATKLAGRMLDSDKVYDFTVAFGVQTDTLDLEGKPIATSDHRPTWALVEAALPRFTGPIEQAPPAYSAILIDGQRAYDLARKGAAVEMKTRSVTIHRLQAYPEDMPHDPLAPVHELTLAAHVSKGTYIRSLARDIALALGTVGHVTMLRRVKAGPFTLESAISLDKLNDAATGHGIAQYMLPLTAGLDDIPALPVSPDEALALRQGKMLMGKPHTGLLLAMLGDTPIALVESSGPDIRVVRGFNL
ncbi:MAG: tRNA pseudouridine(55) synthase TruB [Pseudomonadota bacterium]|uniref:tRNA pseudouridine(55) synthase TruB n=1 Tax=Sphingobium naphthae TaxID=1886786 RepID=UPI002B0D99A0|nr:tRNA pseudouridine(55) synthase TruB [Pseudomonadota bacterium]